MKKIFLLIIISMFYSNFGVADSRFPTNFETYSSYWNTTPSGPRTKNDFINMFLKGRELDIIEGIWMEYAVRIQYGEDRKVIKRELNPKRASWIVIKKDNEFKVLDINGKQTFFNATFAPTNKNRVYQFKCLIYDTKD